MREIGSQTIKARKLEWHVLLFSSECCSFVVENSIEGKSRQKTFTLAYHTQSFTEGKGLLTM